MTINNAIVLSPAPAAPRLDANHIYKSTCDYVNAIREADTTIESANASYGKPMLAALATFAITQREMIDALYIALAPKTKGGKDAAPKFIGDMCISVSSLQHNHDNIRKAVEAILKLHGELLSTDESDEQKDIVKRINDYLANDKDNRSPNAFLRAAIQPMFDARKAEARKAAKEDAAQAGNTDEDGNVIATTAMPSLLEAAQMTLAILKSASDADKEAAKDAMEALFAEYLDAESIKIVEQGSDADEAIAA